MNRYLAVLSAATLGACVDTDGSWDGNGNGNPDDDACLIEDCDTPPLPPLPPPRFTMTSDTSGLGTKSNLAVNGHRRWTFTSVDPAGGTPTVVLEARGPGSLDHASLTVVESTEHSVTVEVTATKPAAFGLAVTNAVARDLYLEEPRDVKTVWFQLPAVYAPETITKVLRGEPALHLSLCTAITCNDADRLIDVSTRLTEDSALAPIRWDTFALPEEPGVYPMTLESAAFPRFTQNIEVVAAIDEIEIDLRLLDATVGTIENAAREAVLCFYGRRGSDRVASSTYTLGKATPSSLQLGPSYYSNCAHYKATSPGSYALTVVGGGRQRDFTLTVP